MASPTLLLCSLSLLLFVQRFSAADVLAPFLDNICKDVMCGKGKCRKAENSTFDFRCECDKGWRQSVGNESDKHPGFLPCVIPNCTLNYSCAKAEPPAPAIKEPPMNKSFFDPCFWAYCGEGTCTKTEKMNHKCECKPGHSNLFNVSSFPCFTDCALGADCKELGISVSNSSAASPSSSAGDDTSDASSVSLCYLVCLGVLTMISTALVPWT